MTSVASQVLRNIILAGSCEELAASLGILVDAGVVLAVAVCDAGAAEVPLFVRNISAEQVRLCGREGALGWTSFPLFGREGGDVGSVWVHTEEKAALAMVSGLMEPLGIALGDRRMASIHKMKADLFDTVVEFIGEGVLVGTTEGELITYNSALEHQTGWTKGDLLSKGWTKLVYPEMEDRVEVMRDIATLTAGTPSAERLRKLKRKDGSVFKAKVLAYLSMGHPDTAPVLMGVFRSVAAERRARALPNPSSKTEVEQLVGGIAHEFNNLLAAIMGHADLITLLSTTEKVRQHAQTIVDSAARGAHITSQLLSYTGTSTVHPRPFPLSDLAEEVANLARGSMPPNVLMRLSIEENLPMAEVDPGALQQILLNVLRNAGLALDAGGTVTLSVERALVPSTVRFQSPTLDPDVKMLRLRIRDDGHGFSSEALEHLFRPFFSERTEGHGLGLATVRSIIAAHLGAVDVFNDGGAVVDLYLPITHRPEICMRSLQEGRRGGGAEIWFVETDAAVLEYSQIYLELQGYNVRTFPSCDAVNSAMRVLQAPRAVVADRELCEPGRGPKPGREEWAAGVPVLWTSGQVGTLEGPKGRGASVLLKPYTGRTLSHRIQELLAGRGPTGQDEQHAEEGELGDGEGLQKTKVFGAEPRSEEPHQRR